MSNSSIWPIDRALSDATTPGRSGPGNNGNVGVLPIHQSSKTGVSPSNGFVLYQEIPCTGVLALCRDAVGVFYCLSWLGW